MFILERFSLVGVDLWFCICGLMRKRACRRNVRWGVWFCITTLIDWLKKLACHFFDQSEVKAKPILVTCSRKFSRGLWRRHVIASGFDWIGGLFCILCDWSEWLLWFWFYDTELKTAFVWLGYSSVEGKEDLLFKGFAFYKAAIDVYSICLICDHSVRKKVF